MKVIRASAADVVSGYLLDSQQKGIISVIRPRAATNIIKNPSFEVDTTGWTGAITGCGTSTIARTTTYQRRDTYALQVTPASNTCSGIRYTGSAGNRMTLTIGTGYYLSFDFLGVPGLAYQAGISERTLGPILSASPYMWYATGRWQRILVPVWIEDNQFGTTERGITIQKYNSSSVAPFYIDGVQVETNRHTSYLDGDMQGIVPGRSDFYWAGLVHYSDSTRISQCRLGGERISLSDLGFETLAIIGLGHGDFTNMLTPLPNGGSYYSGTIQDDKQFTIVGTLTASNRAELHRRRLALIDILKNDVVTPDQPVTLLYTPVDQDGNVIGDELEISCLYQDGMSMSLDNDFQERLSLMFRINDVVTAKEPGNVAVSLTYQRSLARATGNDVLLVRSPDGTWSNILSTMSAGRIHRLLFSKRLNGLYAVGSFTGINGVANTNCLAFYDFQTATWSSLGAITGSNLYAIAELADGSIYVGGDITSAGGVAVKYIAKRAYPSGTWTALAATATAGAEYVADIVIAQDGTLYAGGKFAAQGGVANTVNIASWNGAAWSALSTGTNGAVARLAMGLTLPLYAYGSFSVAGGIVCLRQGKWNGTAWSTLDSAGLQNGPSPVYEGDLLLLPDGTLYASGNMIQTVSGTNYDMVKWNGLSFSVISGSTSTGSGGFDMHLLQDGRIAVAGIDVTNMDEPFGAAIWNGYFWVYLLASLTGGSKGPIAQAGDGKIALVGHDLSGNALVEYNTTIDNQGSTSAGPKFVLTGPGHVYGISNITTGVNIYLDLDLVSGETAVLDLSDTTSIKFYSNAYANLLPSIIRGSNLEMKLIPGNNIISILIAGSTDANTAAAIQWRTSYNSVDGAVLGRIVED